MKKNFRNAMNTSVIAKDSQGMVSLASAFIAAALEMLGLKVIFEDLGDDSRFFFEVRGHRVDMTLEAYARYVNVYTCLGRESRNYRGVAQAIGLASCMIKRKCPHLYAWWECEKEYRRIYDKLLNATPAKETSFQSASSGKGQTREVCHKGRYPLGVRAAAYLRLLEDIMEAGGSPLLLDVSERLLANGLDLNRHWKDGKITCVEVLSCTGEVTARFWGLGDRIVVSYGCDFKQVNPAVTVLQAVKIGTDRVYRNWWMHHQDRPCPCLYSAVSAGMKRKCSSQHR